MNLATGVILWVLLISSGFYFFGGIFYNTGSSKCQEFFRNKSITCSIDSEEVDRIIQQYNVYEKTEYGICSLEEK